VTLLREDPFTQGPKLFAQKCASCHRFDGHDALGHVPAEPQSAPDLQGFGSREWLAGLFDPEQIGATNYFGGTKFRDGRMARFVRKQFTDATPEKLEQLRKVIAALSAEAELPSQLADDARDVVLIAEGRDLIRDEMRCTDCHQFHNVDEDAIGPNLTGYGSRAWLIEFINNPAHEQFYGERNDRMPAFGADGILDSRAIEMIADWLRGSWYEPGREQPDAAATARRSAR
jgi:ubiquinol-cytochrome c reductase cytochrome b subunit